MMLAHKRIHFTIDFKENFIPVLIIEDPVFLRTCVGELISQADGKSGEFVLSEQYNPIDIEKHVFVIHDLFSLELNSRKLLNGLYKYLSTVAVIEKSMPALADVKTALCRWMAVLEQETPYSLAYEFDPEMNALLKALNTRFEEQALGIVEKLMHYMRVTVEFLKQEVCVCVNLQNYLCSEEMLEIYQFAKYRKFSLLRIEGRDFRRIDDCEQTFIIDKDLCEIYDGNGMG